MCLQKEKLQKHSKLTVERTLKSNNTKWPCKYLWNLKCVHYVSYISFDGKINHE